jgi:hypothetical protein
MLIEYLTSGEHFNSIKRRELEQFPGFTQTSFSREMISINNADQARPEESIILTREGN